jgi:hypothetical protein
LRRWATPMRACARLPRARLLGGPCGHHARGWGARALRRGRGAAGHTAGPCKRGESGVGLGHGMGRQTVGGGLGWAVRWRWATGRPREGRGKEAGRVTEQAV